MTDQTIIIQVLQKYLREHYGDSVKNVILFGSQAKGTCRAYSDYDILVLLDKDYSGKDENQILDFCYEISLRFNIIIDVHILSIKELQTIRGKQPIFINALETGIYAWILTKQIDHLWSDTDKNFIQAGLIDIKFGKMINKASNRRTKGDYDSYFIFEKDIVWEMYEEMKLFIKEMEEFINKNDSATPITEGWIMVITGSGFQYYLRYLSEPRNQPEHAVRLGRNAQPEPRNHCGTLRNPPEPRNNDNNDNNGNPFRCQQRRFFKQRCGDRGTIVIL